MSKIQRLKLVGILVAALSMGFSSMAGLTNGSNLSTDNEDPPSPDQWVSLGPDILLDESGNKISGRVNALVVNPAFPAIIHAASPGGGVWTSFDGGLHWTPRTDTVGASDQLPLMVVSSIAMISSPTPPNPADLNVIYIGTGEHQPQTGVAFSGIGVFKSTDGGTTWGPTGTGTSCAPGNSNGAIAKATISKVVVHPSNANIVYAASTSRGAGPTSNTGIFRSIDGGACWFELGSLNSTDALPSNSDVIDLVMDPTNPLRLYLAAWGGGSARHGIYRADNAMDATPTWVKLTNCPTCLGGTLPTSGFAGGQGRVTLAIAASSPSTLYAGYDMGNLGSDRYRLFKTTASGDSWVQLAGVPQDCGGDPTDPMQPGQCNINNVLAVDPTNADIVYLGQVGLYRSTSGGSTPWTPAPCCVGPDQQGFAFDPTNAKILYVADHGGVFRWNTISDSVTSLNNGIVTTQFFGVGIAPTDPDAIAGGAWDAAGTVKRETGRTWRRVACCDAAFADFDAGDSKQLYYFENGCCSSRFKRSSDNQVIGIGGFHADPFRPGHLLTFKNGDLLVRTKIASTGPASELFNPVTQELGPAWECIDRPDPDATCTGTHVDQVSDQGLAFAPSPPDAPVYYLGMQSGSIWRGDFSLPAASRWSKIFTPNPACMCSGSGHVRVAVDPRGDIIYAAYRIGIGSPSGPGRVLRLTRPAGGAGTWIANPIASDLVVPPSAGDSFIVVDELAAKLYGANIVYLGTNQGIYRGVSIDGGMTFLWARSQGVPNTHVTSMKVHPTTGKIVAATFGRGIFERASVGPEVIVKKKLITSGDITLNDGITFEVTIGNTGGSPIVHLPLEDLFEAHYLRFDKAVVLPSGTPINPDAVVDGHLVWKDLSASLGSLIPGASLKLAISFKVAACPPQPPKSPGQNTLKNVTQISVAIDDQGHPAPNASAHAEVKVICLPRVTVTKELIVPTSGPAAIGDLIEFRVRITNTGKTTITKLPLIDTFDSNCMTLELLSVASNSRSKDLNGIVTLKWDDLTEGAIGVFGFGKDLKIGESFTMFVKFIAKKKTSSCVNTARVGGAIDEFGQVAPESVATAEVEIISKP